ncbi:MAG: hypothetical protein Q8K22_07550, partial [Rhodoferax sp.]|nr:hypothetical protein [Rhodoferax sp.]
HDGERLFTMFAQLCHGEGPIVPLHREPPDDPPSLVPKIDKQVVRSRNQNQNGNNGSQCLQK